MTIVTFSAKGRRNRKKAAVRSKIIGAAIRLFSEKGLEHVSVDQIAESADVGKGTIYNYFRSKEDIVVAFMADFERRALARIPSLLTSNRSLDRALADFARAQLRWRRPYHAFVRIFLAQMFSHTAEFMPHMVEMQKAIDAPMEALFQSLQQRGLMRKDVPLSELVLVFKTLRLGLTALWAVEGPPFLGTEKVLRRAMQIFSEGLGT
ncbi:MAG TPA: TetR/AcrR family transcriptional regulator [Candidatus Acidoferrales bacterium]|nr:TetR/AcrR family transcriptional regulator [Candidatus Acidoferrales bacterium]